MAPSGPVQILSKKRIFDHFFKIDEVRLQYVTYRGQLSAPVTRLIFERGDAAAAVVHLRDNDSLFFTEQLRAPTLEKGPGWMLEIPAGMVDSGESPEQTIIREVAEEIGYRVRSPRLISTFYLSPGGSSERIFLYYCLVTGLDRVSAGGGLASEGEDIKTVSLPRAQVLAELESGRFNDAKTLIGLQWLQKMGSHPPKD